MFKILKCERVAAFGWPVVPDVNWIFVGSWQLGYFGRHFISPDTKRSVKLIKPDSVSSASLNLTIALRKWNLFDLRSHGLAPV